jgi:hypothetical protein
MMMAVEVSLVGYDSEHYPESRDSNSFQNYGNVLAGNTASNPKI